MNTSEQINEIAAAMAKAQSQMRPAVKDSTNPAFRSKYADLAAVWEACREPLTSNGIATLQDVVMGERGISVTTRLVHSSGQWIEHGPLTVPMAKQDAHAVGSATSYARRYGLSAAVGIVADDDDGNAAVQAQPAKVPAKAPAGFDSWWSDLHAVADNGFDALIDAFKQSAQPLREYALDAHREKWEALKAKAQKKAKSHAA